MKAIMPAPADWYPLSCFVVLMFALSVAACALPLWAHALYLAWLITGVECWSRLGLNQAFLRRYGAMCAD
jgi:hypothetical protein